MIKPFTIHLAARPNYILAVENGSLVVKVSMLLAPLLHISNYYGLTEALTVIGVFHQSKNGGVFFLNTKMVNNDRISS